MATFFLACFAIGGVVLTAQLAMSLLGMGGDHDLASHDVSTDPHTLTHDGLDLLSVRALAAGTGFLGIIGFASLRAGTGPVLALGLGIASGLGASTGIAWLMRSLRRLEVDKTLDLGSAIGIEGRVHLTIPAQRKGAGKVLVALHDRLLELPAVTPGPAITSGTTILVTDIDQDTLVVATSLPLLPEANDVS
ncbi:MAG: hypothetical protein IPK85_11610 [Gemmatimonadetes bacterium]|nr:hypothetical protein [Gemmatimonadota bacterium]